MLFPLNKILNILRPILSLPWIITIVKIFVMHSTWLDNDHQRNTGINRIENASKKQLPNRIQVYILRYAVFLK